MTNNVFVSSKKTMSQVIHNNFITNNITEINTLREALPKFS